MRKCVASQTLQPLLIASKDITFMSASWSSRSTFVTEAGGKRFKSWTAQIEHSFANGSPPLRYCFERSCTVARAQ